MRWGLIGCGGIGALRAQALQRLASCCLDAVSDVDAGRAHAIAQGTGSTIAPDWQTLVQRPSVDAVLISTPPHLHADMCIAALQAGKHVLCEKPLARTPAECQRMLEAAQHSKRLLATGFNYRFYPSVQKAQQLLTAGVIGPLDHIRSYAGYTAADHEQAWIHDPEIVGGGALRDNGIHLIDLTRFFLGEVAEVKGFASNAVWGFAGCEDNGFALLRSPTGQIASVHASWTEWRKYRFALELYGSRGCIRVSCFPMLTQVVWASTRGGRSRRKTYWFPLVQVYERLRSYRWLVMQSFQQELQAFQHAVQGHPGLLATGYDGLRAVEIAHAATLLPPATATALDLPTTTNVMP